MIFNSFIFIMAFLPITVIAYYMGNKINLIVGKVVIVLASLCFYAYTDMKSLLILGTSVVVNYFFSLLMYRFKKYSGVYMIVPIILNTVLLLYFKYVNFAIDNFNNWVGKEWAFRELILPIGISFFTFQQIAYIVSVRRGEVSKCSFLDYLAYILYFPKILMGPLMEPVEFLEQFNDETRKRVNWDNLAAGIKIFSLGLFKKVMIADVFSKAVAWGFSNSEGLTSMEWIVIMLSYTFEIYFDFSGYSDMATGVSAMLNITLPINFDSPYKALSIRDFWSRWHISLTKFFTKYIYIPLGGSRRGLALTCVNTMIVFLISGIWHGANWTFILWGILHGIFMIIDRVADKMEGKIFEAARWLWSFTIVNVLWLLFRAESIAQWKSILHTVRLFQDMTVREELLECFILPEMPFLERYFHIGGIAVETRGFWMLVYLLLALIVCIVPENNYKKMNKHNLGTLVVAALAFIWGIICLSGESVFVYFNF